MRLFKPAITVEDWSGAKHIRSAKDYAKWRSYYMFGRIKWVKGEKAWRKYETDECVLCGSSLYYWYEMAEGLEQHIYEEYDDANFRMPRNLCQQCSDKLYERVTLGIR